MLDNRKRIYALQSWTVEKKAKGWFIRRTDHDESCAGHIPAQRARASRSLASSNANSSSVRDFPPRLLTP
jgi:hypothetical protein